MSDRFLSASRMHCHDAASEAFAVEFGRFLDQTDGVRNPDRLFCLLSTFALNFDCPWIAYGCLTPDKRALKPVRGDAKVMLQYPDEWQERYCKMSYETIDPIIRTSRTRACAFRWSEVYNDASTTDDERRFFDEAATFGMNSGVSVPLHDPDGSLAIMNFAQAGEGEFANRTINYLQLAALHFHLRLAKSANSSGSGETPALSPREKECIVWTAKGKSSWEIGMILGISTNTVNFHIKNVMRKTDTGSRTAAAIKALRARIIEL
ncbi:helix-turn-helix transcriptional regulator [Mesorhizobium prunaredense]|nr:LuxR family transcriptional regulator [Mesorhizobium prunaredense]